MAVPYYTNRRDQQIVPIWNYRALLNSLGTGSEIAARITAAGYDAPSRKTINAWAWRGRIPSAWTPLFLLWAFREGKIDDISELLVKDKVTL